MTLPPVSYKRHRFPTEIIGYAIWLYFRFPLSLRLVEEMLFERGILVSYETVRRWALKFGQEFARRLKRKRPSRGDIWHLDEVVVSIAGKTHWLWRAVDQEGYVLDEILQTRRDSKAAARLLRRLLNKQGVAPASSPTSLALTPQRERRSCPRSSIARISASTTALKTLICPFDGENERCKDSDRRGACNGSSAYSPPSVITLFRPAPVAPLCPSTCTACALSRSGSSSPALPSEPALKNALHSSIAG
jgi:hypothetical protein